jgi:hypothetical protein
MSPQIDVKPTTLNFGAVPICSSGYGKFLPAN